MEFRAKFLDYFLRSINQQVRIFMISISLFPGSWYVQLRVSLSERCRNTHCEKDTKRDLFILEEMCCTIA